VIASLLIAFLCGSIPVALIIGKSMRGLDVREHGSGNAGSTNAIRVLGLGPGLLVFLGDVLKGALGCVIVALATLVLVPVASSFATAEAFQLMQGSTDVLELDPILSILASGHATLLHEVPMALAVVATILGHMFSPFMGFKGGKGVATALGAITVTLPLTAICSLSVFIVVVLISRYVSLGSIIAIITVPIFTALFPLAFPDLVNLSPTYIVFTTLIAIVVVWAHRKNIVRLSKKEEPKFSIPKKDKAYGQGEDSVIDFVAEDAAASDDAAAVSDDIAVASDKDDT